VWSSASRRASVLGWTDRGTADAEAYANATSSGKLFVAISVALLVMLLGGLLRVPRARSRARPRQWLPVSSILLNIRPGDECADLGDAFNTMAKRLVELQEDVKRQERQATIGRIAAGLVHDLAHPIQNLGNCSRLLVRTDLDAESRLSTRATIERELENLKRFMDDLRHVVMPRPVERFLLEVNGSLAEVVEAMRTEGAGWGSPSKRATPRIR
jgi:signal transduction histidine kinase